MPNENSTPFRRRDYLKITALGFAITALWQSLHSIILPQRLLDFVPETQKNTYLGLMTLTGLLLAMFVQPIAGAFSDRSGSKWGRRRPYILIGGVITLLILPGVGLAGSFAVLFAVYCLLQVASNTAQGPFQALIPDLAPPDKRGLASGVKALLEIVGGVILVYISSLFINRYAAGEGSRWLWLVLGILAVVLLGTLAATLAVVKETPSVNDQPPYFTAGVFSPVRRARSMPAATSSGSWPPACWSIWLSPPSSSSLFTT